MSPEEIVEYWLDEVGPKGWYGGGEALDNQIRDRYMGMWQEATEGAFGLWLIRPRGVLAYLILTDQFPRNMFRDDPRAFATDASARAAAKGAIDHGWDLRWPEPGRQFFYLPLMHSENLTEQDRCVRLVADRMPVGKANTLVHARAHREVIRRFGRFPYRNKALGRTDTQAEAAFMTAGGYGAILRELSESGAA